jgi:hypothetical protein
MAEQYGKSIGGQRLEDELQGVGNFFGGILGNFGRAAGAQYGPSRSQQILRDSAIRLPQPGAMTSRTTPAPISQAEINARLEGRGRGASALIGLDGFGGGGGGAPRGNPIDALFAPMFESLDQRERLANQRYEANREQVTNIYGQITGARTADIATTGEAYKNLTDAASARSTAVNTSIDESEAARLRNNQAALESMGLGGLSTSQGDLASQGAAMAKGTNVLNAENWQNLLTAMGATSQDLARSDVTGFNYRMGEDLGQLRGARENFQENIGQERTGLLGQQAQANFDYQRAQQAAAASAAAATQKATIEAAAAASKQFAGAIEASGPLTNTLYQRQVTGVLTPAGAQRVGQIFAEYFLTAGTQGQGVKASEAIRAIFAAGEVQLSSEEQLAIIDVANNMFPRG